MEAMDVTLSHMPRAGTLAEQLKLQRERKSGSLNDLAQTTGMSRMTLRSLEAGGGSLACLDRYISTLAPAARLKEPPRASWNRSISRRGDDQFTPPEFIEKIQAIFGPIDLDPAWHAQSPVEATRTFSLAAGENGLARPWVADFVWLNPPFSELLRWLRKADGEWSAGRAKTIIALVPARTDSTYFHDRLARVANIYLLRRRLRFIQLDGRPGNQAPFPLMLMIFGAGAEQLASIGSAVAGLWVGRPAAE